MVTLSLLKLLENNGFGVIDEDLFWQKMGIEDDGLYISDIGGGRGRGERNSVTYQIYCRGENDIAAYQRLQTVADFLTNSFSVCSLPAVPPITRYGYNNVTILPTSSISNVGEDINGRVIYSITGQLYYGTKTIVEPPPLSLPITTETGMALITEDNKLLIS